MELHDGQRKFLQQSNKKINLLVSGNRWGKSTLIGIKHIHHNFYKTGINPGNSEAWAKTLYRTGNIAPHSKLVEPVFNTILAILNSAFPIPQKDGSLKSNECQIGWFLDKNRIRNTAPMQIHYVNRSFTEFSSTGEDKGDSLQGRPFGYLSYDEGGRSDHLQYELDSNILPRLGDWNGTLDIPSTPDQASPSIMYHHDLFERGQLDDPDIYSQEGSALENHFLPDNYVPDTIRRMKGNPLLDQVIYGKFVFAGANLFPASDINNARDASLDNGVLYEEGHNYIIGIDTAMGEDEMVYTVLDTTTNLKCVRQIGCKGNAKSPQMHINDFVDLFNAYNVGQTCKVILETWNGESARFYQDLPPHIQRKTKCFGSWQPPGIKPTGRNPKSVRKAELIIALQKVLANGELKLPHEQKLIKQLSVYREDDVRLQTDRVMSLALAVWRATDGKAKVDNIVMTVVEW